MTATNSYVAKVVAVAAALMMVATSFAFVPTAKAQSTSDLQAQINALLATIAALQAQLAGTSTGGSTGTTTTACTFTRDLTLEVEGADVTCLQTYLKATGHFTHPTATGYFGPITRDAVAKWQAANGVTPAAGYFGAISRAKYTAVAGTTTPGTGTGTGTGTVPTGTAFRVALASDSPSNTALVQGQGIGELAKFTFSNPTSAEVKVTSLVFNRTGVSNDSTLSNVYLYDGGTRITDSAGISNSQFSFNDTTGVVTVPAMSTKTISVRSDIAAQTAGQIVGVALVSVGTTAALDSSVSFPINSGMQSISAADLATVAFNTYTGPNNATMNPENDSRVFEATINVGTRAVNLSSITLENRGGTSDADFRNLKLFIDGSQVGSTVTQTTNSKVTFSFATPVRLETGNRVIRLNADIVGGSGETFDFELRRTADALFYDSQLNQPISVTGSGTGATTANTVAAATLSVVRAANSPQSNISVDSTSVKLGSYEFRAAGENLKIEEMTVAADTSVSNGGLDNGKVFLNGVQIGSTRDIAEAGTAFTFGSQMILQQGETAIVDIYADAKTTTGASLANGETITVSVAITGSNTEGMDSGDSVSSISAVNAFAITVSSASLTGSKFTGYSNQTMVAGANNAKIGSFTLSGGSTEGVNVNNIVIDMSAANAASITDLRLMDGGAQLGTAKASPSTSNAFSVNFAIPASGTKTIDVYANIKSGANAGIIVATLDGTSGGTGATTGSSITVVNDVTLQEITVAGSGTLSVSVGAGDPDSNNVIAGASQIKVGEFNFAAANTAFTVQELKVALPGAAAAVTGVTLRYQDANGATQTVTQSVVSSGANATASFTGLTFYVPANNDANLEVLVGTPTTAASSQVSGKSINVSLAGGAGHFKAVDTAGNQDTNLNATDVFSGGTFVPRRSIPTLAMQPVSLSVPTAGQDLYRFTVTADAAGAIDWKKISFAVSTTSLTASGFTLYDVTSGSSAMNGSSVDANSSGVVAIVADSVQQVGAGQTKTYALRASSITGWNGGSQITISFQGDTGVVTDTYSTVAGSHDIVWSDRSATGHSESTSDWTNGNLLKDLDNDIKQFYNSN